MSLYISVMKLLLSTSYILTSTVLYWRAYLLILSPQMYSTLLSASEQKSFPIWGVRADPLN